MDIFFNWIKKAEFVSDVLIRLVVLIVVGGVATLLWFISVPVLVWYFYKKFGNKRIRGCRCNNCHIINSCQDKFCINCGYPLNISTQYKQESKIHKEKSCNCLKCNTKNDCNAKFCINCGATLNNNSDLYKEIFYSIDGIIVALLAKIAKSDGKISKDEATYLSHVFEILSKKRENSTNVREIYKEILENEKENSSNIDELCTLIQSFSIENDFQVDIIRIFVELAYIDGSYDKNEENIIIKIIHNLKIDFSIYQNIKNEFESKQKSNSSSKSSISLDECYEILESKKSDTMDLIKKNYRRLAKQYHYDSIVSKNLPKDMIKFAEEKSKVINEAYEKIKKSRA